MDARDALARPRGAGALLHTEVERVDLGDHHGRRLVARIEHRMLRLALGRRWSGTLTLGRRRPVAIEVGPGDGVLLDPSSTAPHGAPRYDEVDVPAPVEPWARYARRAATVALACWLLGRAAGSIRARATGRTTGESA